MSTPHYFIAIHIPEPLQTTFKNWQNILKEKLPYKQWYHKNDLHITLKFLGAVEEEKLVDLVSRLDNLEKISPFEIEVGTLGTFGKPTNPRVLWAGVERHKDLISLQKDIEDIAEQIGFKKENRAYRPHITLAKKWAGKNSNTVEYLQNVTEAFPDTYLLQVNQFTLFQIHPERQQKYEVIKQFRLR